MFTNSCDNIYNLYQDDTLKQHLTIPTLDIVVNADIITKALISGELCHQASALGTMFPRVVQPTLLG